MKQKLLNSFTWRGTLLVALLCTTFSAWAEGTTTLTFSSNSQSVSVDDVTWAISGTGQSFNTSDNAWSSGTSNNTYCTFTTTSSITGQITKIVVNAKGDSKSKVDVKVNGSSVGSSTSPSSSSSYNDITFSPSPIKVDGKNKIVVTGTTGKGRKTVYIKSITVYYTSDPKFVINSACYGTDENNEKRYFGTYSYEYPFKVPAAGDNDVKVFTINVEGDALHLNQLSASTIVPANTGVLVSATAGGTYAAVSTLASGEALEDNLLVASSVAMSGNYKNYHLSMKGGNIGFYWGAANGGTFDIDENKAYLAVPTSSGIKGFAFGDGTNGIQAIENEKAESNAIYNLAGQRVSKMQKGIYVVNGKKVLVK